MYWIAFFLRTSAVLAATLVGYVAVLVAAALSKLAPQQALRLRNAAFSLWAGALLKAFRVEVDVVGEAPPAGSMLIANHTSYVDIPLIASTFDAAFVAKADISGWPLLGTIFAAAQTVYIDRARKRDLVRVMAEMDRHRRRGLGLMVFPEGTSGAGDDILPLRPSLLQYAVDRGIPVYWATLEYRTPAGEMAPSRAVCWWGNEALLPHYLRLMRLSRVQASLRFGPAPLASQDRKALAYDLRQAMLGSFTPMD